VSALCLFVDDLVPSNARKPPQFNGFWEEFLVLGRVRVIRDSRCSRELEAKSFKAWHHLVTHIISPKSWLKSFSCLGDLGRLWGGVLASLRVSALFDLGQSVRGWRIVHNFLADRLADHLHRAVFRG
jgi:hypothetical protein